MCLSGGIPCSLAHTCNVAFDLSPSAPDLLVAAGGEAALALLARRLLIIGKLPFSIICLRLFLQLIPVQALLFTRFHLEIAAILIGFYKRFVFTAIIVVADRFRSAARVEQLRSSHALPRQALTLP